MNIQDATKIALSEGRCIARIDDWTAGRTKIKPTDTPDCCILIDCKGEQAPGKRWHPQADDLISESWIVVD